MSEGIILDTKLVGEIKGHFFIPDHQRGYYPWRVQNEGRTLREHLSVLSSFERLNLNFSDQAIEVEKKHHERKSDCLFGKKSNDQRFIAYRRDRDF